MQNPGKWTEIRNISANSQGMKKLITKILFGGRNIFVVVILICNFFFLCRLREK